MSIIFIANNKKALVDICLPVNATPSLKFAGRELSSFLNRITGAEFNITETGFLMPVSIPRLCRGVVSTNAKLKTIFLERTSHASLGDDGYSIRECSEGIILAGNTDRGVLYAVYSFLEDYCACRWYAYDCSRVPFKPDFSVEINQTSFRPAFRYREAFFSVCADRLWSVRNKCNGGLMHELDAITGGKITYAGFAHTFYPLLPPEKYFKKHPEYFSEQNGRRFYDHGQLCLTNPDVIDIVTEGVIKTFKSDPGAMIASVTQNDCNGWCECRNCRKVDEYERSRSGTIVRFVNEIARRVKKIMPGKFIDTFAYMYGIAPPKHTIPEDNVIIRVCHLTMNCDVHPIQECAENREFKKTLERWCAISKEVFVWDYFNNFVHYFLPMPNIDALKKDIPYYADTGVTGVFCQGDSNPAKGCGDFAELKGYLLAKLLWNPKTDTDKDMKDFIKEYYGNSAGSIYDYLEMLHKRIRNKKIHTRAYAKIDQGYLDEKFMKSYRKIFKRAEKLADNGIIRERVLSARLPIDYVDIKRNSVMTLSHDKFTLKHKSVKKILNHFCGLAEKRKAKGIGENRLTLKEFRNAFNPHPAVSLRNSVLKITVAPDLGGRLISIVTKKDNREWVFNSETDDPFYPMTGGYEEYTSIHHRSNGWKEKYSVSKTENHMTLSAKTADGFALKRTFSLHENMLSILTNVKNIKKVNARLLLRCHPELNLPLFADGKIYVAYGTGKKILSAKLFSKNTVFESSDTNISRIEIVSGDCKHRFIMKANSILVDKYYFNWDIDKQVIRPEIFCRAVDLKPEEEFFFNQIWRLESD